MKICFVQREPFAYFGVMAISGYLKDRGIETAAVIATLEDDVVSSVKEVCPDIIGISVMTPEHGWLVSISAELKSALPDVPLIVGGVHAILYPAEILAIPSVDFVCAGEGESFLTRFCNELASRTLRPEEILGLAYRKDGSVLVNEREMLTGSLNDFMEDREVYYSRYPALRRDDLKQFVASRGCPYTCSFCFNEQLRNIFRGKGAYVRVKDPDHLIQEIRQVRDSSNMRTIFFADDLFTLNKKWLTEFLPLYRSEIGIPFMCTTRANLMDDEIASLLFESGCHTVSFGVETGSEKIRNTVLLKGVKNEDIERCAAVLKRHGIRIQTSNMFCLPDETLEDAFGTVRLNARIGTDLAFATLFMPFPGTRLASYCIERGYLDKSFSFSDLPISFLSHSILKLPDRVRIENVQRCSYFMIRFPSLQPLGEWLIRTVRWKWLFFPLIFIGTFLRYKEERDISLTGAIRFLWRFRKSW